MLGFKQGHPAAIRLTLRKALLSPLKCPTRTQADQADAEETRGEKSDSDGGTGTGVNAHDSPHL